MRKQSVYLLALFALASGLCACRAVEAPASVPARDPVADAPEATPPFDLHEGAEGLYLIWYDADGGAHTASKIADVPAERRARVRVDSLSVAPEARLDPAFVYVADLTHAKENGRYRVRKVGRDAFEAHVLPVPAALATANTAASAATASRDVILYGASWCGACKQARRYFTQKGIAFIEKDIESEPGARSEMLAKGRAQGVSTSGIPVIDVRGTLVGGFDPRRIDSLLATN